MTEHWVDCSPCAPYGLWCVWKTKGAHERMPSHLKCLGGGWRRCKQSKDFKCPHAKINSGKMVLKSEVWFCSRIHVECCSCTYRKKEALSIPFWWLWSLRMNCFLLETSLQPSNCSECEIMGFALQMCLQIQINREGLQPWCQDSI